MLAADTILLILVYSGWRQEDHKLDVSLGSIVRPCLKNVKQNKTKKPEKKIKIFPIFAVPYIAACICNFQRKKASRILG